MFKSKVNTFIFGLAIFIFLSLILGSLANYFILKTSDSIVTINYVYQQEHMIEKHNLSFPFPNNEDIIKRNILVSNDEQLRQFLFNLPLQQFHQEVINNYHYEPFFYDCNYWAYLWSAYVLSSQDINNLQVKIIDTDNHVFAMAYNESGYCIMDGSNLECLWG